MTTQRQRATSGSEYEERFGFSRAVRAGSIVAVAGTAPIWPDGSCDPDPAVQTTRCFEIIAEALITVGSSLGDVTRTRIYITDASDAEHIGAAHRRAVGGAAPAATMIVVAGLVDPRWKVEIDVDAVIDD